MPETITVDEALARGRKLIIIPHRIIFLVLLFLSVGLIMSGYSSDLTWTIWAIVAIILPLFYRAVYGNEMETLGVR
jgi:hypothetical protein